jgi:(R,R)-butanediol dehydrogenase / meso-butanediol dehydrogenase / diacetyl reductase
LKAARYHLAATGALQVDDAPVPLPGAGEVLVRVAYCGICGSDLARYRQLPAPPPALRALLGAVSPTAGHEISGVVAALGPGAPDRWPDGAPLEGSRVVVHPQVACGECASCRAGYWTGCAHPETIRLIGLHLDGGFADAVAVPADHLVRVPNSLSLEDAALAEPLAVALRSLHVARVEDTAQPVAVMGDGPIGLLTAHLLRARGHADVTLIGRHAGRLALGAELGVEQRLLVDEAGPAHDERYQTIFQTAGTQAALESGLRLLARGGAMVTIAYLHGDDPGLHAGLIYQMIRREKAARGACGYSLAELAEAVSLLDRRAVDVRPLVSAVIDLDAIVPQGFEALAGDAKAPGKILVRPS